MKLTSFYSVILTEQVEVSKNFTRAILDLRLFLKQIGT